MRIGFGANVTGLAGMVAYSALMALVLLALFVVSLVLEAPGARVNLLADLDRIFPTAARDTLQSALQGLRGSQITLGLGALVSSAWAGIALWSTIDTAFRDVYGYSGRTWLEQKRWAARMLAIALALPLALLAVPTLHSVVLGGAANLPFGLSSAGSVGLGRAGWCHMRCSSAYCARSTGWCREAVGRGSRPGPERSRPSVWSRS